MHRFWKNKSQTRLKQCNFLYRARWIADVIVFRVNILSSILFEWVNECGSVSAWTIISIYLWRVHQTIDEIYTLSWDPLLSSTASRIHSFLLMHDNFYSDNDNATNVVLALNWKTWNGINWLALDRLMASTVFMMCSFLPSFDWPKEFQSTVQLTHFGVVLTPTLEE